MYCICMNFYIVESYCIKFAYIIKENIIILCEPSLFLNGIEFLCFFFFFFCLKFFNLFLFSYIFFSPKATLKSLCTFQVVFATHDLDRGSCICLIQSIMLFMPYCHSWQKCMAEWFGLYFDKVSDLEERYLF